MHCVYALITMVLYDNNVNIRTYSICTHTYACAAAYKFIYKYAVYYIIICTYVQ